jgi:hypothetical protein
LYRRADKVFTGYEISAFSRRLSMTNHNRTQKVIRLLSTVVIALLFFSSPAFGGENIASFRSVKGTIDVLKKGSLPSFAAKAGDSLSTGDIVRTKSDSVAEVLFKDGSLLKIAQRSRIDIGVYYGDMDKNLAVVKLSRGKVEAVVPKPGEKLALKGGERQFEIHTPNAVAGVRGTSWWESYSPELNTTDVAVSEDDVYVYNLSNPELVTVVNGGNYTSVRGEQPPTPPQPGTGGFSEAAVPFSYPGSTAGKGVNSGINPAAPVGPNIPAAAPPPTAPPSFQTHMPTHDTTPISQGVVPH